MICEVDNFLETYIIWKFENLHNITIMVCDQP
jgi:hypothetical protein